jgi:precorrin-6B methylase 2
MRTHRLLLVGVALIALLGPVAVTTAQSPAPATAPPAAAPAPRKDLDVPYVPTPPKVVAEMLAMARVGKNDLLYDLGSGDGRIVIAAAQRFGTRGVGIDIDPERIKEANQKAREAGVTKRVRFIRGDIFEADIRDATVVTLYLLPAVNMKLRPKLLEDLRPGTRIVSHNYDMGDWKPEKVTRMRLPSGEHTVYYWVVPAKAGEGR